MKLFGQLKVYLAGDDGAHGNDPVLLREKTKLLGGRAGLALLEREARTSKGNLDALGSPSAQAAQFDMASFDAVTGVVPADRLPANPALHLPTALGPCNMANPSILLSAPE